MTSLKQTIMNRDNLSSSEADEQITAARRELNQLLSHGEEEAAYEVCATHFSLEPDYLMDLM